MAVSGGGGAAAAGGGAAAAPAEEKKEEKNKVSVPVVCFVVVQCRMKCRLFRK